MFLKPDHPRIFTESDIFNLFLGPTLIPLKKARYLIIFLIHELTNFKQRISLIISQ